MNWVTTSLYGLVVASLVYGGWTARGWYDDAITLPGVRSELQEARDQITAEKAARRAAEAAVAAADAEAAKTENDVTDRLRGIEAHVQKLKLGSRGCFDRSTVRLFNDLAAGADLLPEAAGAADAGGEADPPVAPAR